MSEYPVQISKVQAPPLREETLARDRLLEWLSVKIHRRAILLIAEAGYGKTTLLADFSRRTRLRVLWFRLDRGDRDWVGLLAYLVAAVRIHVPDFGASTSALLRETATAAPPIDTVLDTFLRELGGLPNDPTALVFDDFHLVDDSPDVRHVLRELLTRGPERMSFVFASRREPPIRLARLRALGEVAELGTDDLRFDAAETERLFRETYSMRLEPALLAELRRRTEGWAASLQLVRAAIHDRDPGQVRAFISSLSGAEGHLYEYLAEEVVGELPSDLQLFLMRTSVLDTVDLTLGTIAAEVDDVAARGMIDDGERHGLFSKGSPNSRHVVRAHPLVRDFLQDRLARSVGEDGVQAIHLRVARVAEPVDWRLAARHYLAAGHEDDARRVLSAAIEQILATGAYAAAQDLASSLPSGGLAGAADLVLRSRLAQQRAAVAEGLELAEQAWASSPDSIAVLLNLVTARSLAGDVAGALEAGRLLENAPHEELAHIGRAYQRVVETSTFGSLDVAASELARLAELLGKRGERHFQGVAYLNLSYARLAMNQLGDALSCAEEAVALLASTSAGVELISARLARATALAFLERIREAREEVAIAKANSAPGQSLELAFEVGQFEALVGDSSSAWPLIQRVDQEVDSGTDPGEQALLTRVLLQVRDGDLEAAQRGASSFQYGQPRTSISFEARRHLVNGLVLALREDPEALATIRVGADLAMQQGANLWERYGTTMAALATVSADPSRLIDDVAKDGPVVLSMLAELVVKRLKDFGSETADLVVGEARRRPWRWRQAARRLLESEIADDRLAAARLLSAIGEIEDVRRLRDAGKSLRARGAARLGFDLARRLAARVMVEDLGRVAIHIGARSIEGSEIRRKVLGLLCLLLSKPRFASTREEVVDALWPDQDPASALNSLNQTVYFLRRVFEPEYLDELSPGYVGQDGETVWLDPELIDCRSRRCVEFVRSMQADPNPEACVALAQEYTGRFALDFAYEDWSAAYRDSLHATYLRVMERAVRQDLASGHSGRGTFLAERAAEVDPEADEIRTLLIRLYRLSGAHSAAAEQYGHYARAMRELGEEPVPLSDV